MLIVNIGLFYGTRAGERGCELHSSIKQLTIVDKQWILTNSWTITNHSHWLDQLNQLITWWFSGQWVDHQWPSQPTGAVPWLFFGVAPLPQVDPHHWSHQSEEGHRLGQQGAMARCQRFRRWPSAAAAKIRGKPGIILDGYDGFGGFDGDITMVMMVVMMKWWWWWWFWLWWLWFDVLRVKLLRFMCDDGADDGDGGWSW